MIRINLLKPGTVKKPSKPFPLVKVLVVVAVCVGVLLSAALGLWGVQQLRAVSAKKKVKHTEVVAVSTHEPTEGVSAEGPGSSFEPSTHTNPSMVEDIVSDTDTPKTKSGPAHVVELSYEEMSRAEQINYEVYFVQKTLDILSKQVPKGIGFSTLFIDNFQNVSGTGLAPTREAVTSLFSALRSERFNMIPPPNSYIRSNKGQGYHFVFKSTIAYGSHLGEGSLATDYLVTREQLASMVRKFAKTAVRDGVTLECGPSPESNTTSGEYRRFQYHVSGKGSYRNFAKFVLHCANDQIPCAFKTIRFKARSASSVDISADVIFTTRN